MTARSLGCKGLKPRREIPAMYYNRPTDTGSEPRPYDRSMASVYVFSAALMIIGLVLIYQ